MKIIVIGGSIGGLITAIALADQGFDVEIYERSAADMKGRGAGLVIQPDMMEYLMEKGISPKTVFGVPALERQVLDENGHAVLTYANDTIFTSWNYIWRQLKAHFNPDKYFYGYELEGIKYGKDSVVANFKNGETRTADLVVGADGYNSVVREYIVPKREPQYAGYVAFRGLIPEEEMKKEDIAFFANRFSIYPYEHSHLLCYLVPGPQGELTPGKRLFNWVWYLNKSHPALEKLMTDKNGLTRKYTVPAGFLSEENLQELHELAQKQLPPILRDSVLQTKHPFVQVIVDLAVPVMYKDRVCILGDAAFVVRPHTASGTAKAYRDALALANSLREHHELETALKHWNEQEKMYATALIIHGKQLAFRSQLGFTSQIIQSE